jgi:DNA polymerase I-like protein with 3'-5' exonuclease and polymerase domains
VVEDIEKTKPKAIFGFGAVPLSWAVCQSGIAKWRGRRVPIKVGNHVCWFFPMYHPSFILRTRKFRPDSLNEYGSELEFAFALDLKRAFDSLDELPDPVVYDRVMATHGVDYVTGAGGEADVQKVLAFLQGLYDEKVVGLDYETNALHPYRAGTKILTVALSSRKKSLAFPLYHQGCCFTDRQRQRVRDAYEKFLRHGSCRKVVHNLPFELEWTGVKFDRDLLHGTKWGCTLSQAYILDERQGRNRPGCLSLRFLCLQHFGIDIKDLNPVDRADLDNTSLREVLPYNAVDAKFHRLLYLKQRRRIRDEGLREQYQHNLRRLPTLVLTQMQGVPIDQKQVAEFDELYSGQLAEVDRELELDESCRVFQKRFGKPFRVSSNADVLKMLTDVLDLEVEADRDGKKSADAAFLRKVDTPVAKLILRHRAAAKMHSTYVLPVKEGSPNLYHSDDGPGFVVHPVISTTTTETWRTSSEDPNIQNWPKRTNKEIRRQASGGGDLVFVSFDYAGIQARNVAMESEDKALVEAFWKRYDIHSDWMERIYETYPRWIPGGLGKLSKDERKAFRHKAKNLFVFPSFFGAQPYSISRTLQIPERVIERVHAEFWGLFEHIYDWHERIRSDYRTLGYVTGLSGFRRRAPISPTQLINAPIQADESVIVMDAMCRLSEMQDPRFQACLMVHDDLTFLWRKKEVERNAEVVISAMLKTSYDWAKIVPLGVEMQVGANWADQEAVGEYFSDTWNGNL